MYPMYSLLNLKIPSFGLRISRIRFQGSGIIVTRARGSNHLPPTQKVPRSRVTPEWKVTNFKPFSNAANVMKIGTKATQNHEKRTLETWEIQLLRKSIFAIHPLPNAWFFNPRHPDSDSKSIRTNNLQISITILFLLVPRYPKSAQNMSPKSVKN